MALTMTRTRTQTALNKLAENLAEVNGELQFLAGLSTVPEDHQALAAARREELLRLREALFVVIKRYDSELEPDDIGTSFQWMKPFGRRPTVKTVQRYFSSASIGR